MATPKKRTGKAAQNSRRANWKGSVPATTTCPNCKAIIPTHTVCPECGYYKDKVVSIKKAPVVLSNVKENKEVVVNTDAETKVDTTEEANSEEKPKKTRKPRTKKTTEEETSEEKAE